MGDTELEISTRAYCKMLMHAAKYPSSSINGVLLSKVTNDLIVGGLGSRQAGFFYMIHG